jgi:hypothetical protein
MRSTKRASHLADEDSMKRIADAVEKLAGEVEVLRGVIDRLQDDLAWALNNDAFAGNNRHREPCPPMHITSMPRDPLASDWHERLNRFRPEDLPDLDDDDDGAERTEAVQRDLFS